MLFFINFAEDTAVGIRRADHVASSIGKKLTTTMSTSGGRSVGIVRSRTQATDVRFSFLHKVYHFLINVLLKQRDKYIINSEQLLEKSLLISFFTSTEIFCLAIPEKESLIAGN
jgi:hypothetical protein